MKKAIKPSYKFFAKTLDEYKIAIDQSIASYSKDVKKSTLKNYGAYSRVANDAFFDILSRGGKRVRGSLAMLGYEMSGGKDKKMIVDAARAIEIMHAYILIIDDIQDRSLSRRGGPTAHVMLADYHRSQGLAGDSDHFGVSLALNAALGGAHAAGLIISNLDTTDELKLKVLNIVNHTMLVTSHGQTNDIANEASPLVDKRAVERVMEWKTAHYSLLNPLHVGMVLAGAGCGATDAITDYAIHTGKAYQITDDIIGVFGSKEETGKNPGEDIKAGKQTLLVNYALEFASGSDKNFLVQMLGNQHLKPSEFDRVKLILVESGALDYAKSQAVQHVKEALDSLETEEHRWSNDGVRFLQGLANFLLSRQR